MCKTCNECNEMPCVLAGGPGRGWLLAHLISESTHAWQARARPSRNSSCLKVLRRAAVPAKPSREVGRNGNRARPGKGRLTAIALYGVVRELDRRLGFKVWPHGLRHAAITEALDLTGGNVWAVQRFSRHRDVRVLERYDDNRRDLGGEVAKQVAASVPGENLPL
jgi:integrase